MDKFPGQFHQALVLTVVGQDAVMGQVAFLLRVPLGVLLFPPYFIILRYNEGRNLVPDQLAEHLIHAWGRGH